MKESLEQVIVQEVQGKKRNWERVLLYGICFLLLLWGFKGCFDTSKLEGQMAIQKKEITSLKKEYKKEKETFTAFQDSVRKDTQQKNDSIKLLREENKKHLNNISIYKKENQKQKEQLQNWDKKHQISFLKAYYKTEDIVETSKGIELQNNTPIQVISTIYDAEMYKRQFREAWVVIENQKQEIKLEQGKTLNAEVERDKSLGLLSKSEEIVSKQDDYIKNADKTISRLKTQKLFTTIALPVGIGLGIVTGILIAK